MKTMQGFYSPLLGLAEKSEDLASSCLFKTWIRFARGGNGGEGDGRKYMFSPNVVNPEKPSSFHLIK